MKKFLNQFPGGETTENCIPKIQYLRNKQIGTLPRYNIEAKLDGSSKDPALIPKQTQLVLESIDAQGQLAKQSCPDAKAIASKAQDNNVRIVIDAEQSWYQPVIDSLTDELMQKYNTLDGPATCIASLQAYLRRYAQLLDQQVARAEERGYKLLFNQIQGAYIVTDAERWKTDGKQGHGPVLPTKEGTDASFNYGIEKTVATIAPQVRETGHSKLSAVFATHNSISVGLGLDLLQKHGLARRNYENGKLVVSKEIAGSFAFAQLYGKLPFLRSRDDNASD
ncbi:proline dehydrogenase [Fusarium odoratissimum]